MQNCTCQFRVFSALAGVCAVLTAASVHAAEKAPVGVSRISDAAPTEGCGVGRCNDSQLVQTGFATAADDAGVPVYFTSDSTYVDAHGTSYVIDHGQGGHHHHQARQPFGGWWHNQSVRYAKRNRQQSMVLNKRLRCKFGFLFPSGCCGKGCWPFGLYDIVYATDPAYAHPQDGKAHAARGYGVPMAVPLAPTVHYTYNYGWGLPSSRLTPVSRHVPGL